MIGAGSLRRQGRGRPTLPLLALAAAAGLGLLLLLLGSGPVAPAVVEVAARRSDDPAKPFVFDPEVIEVSAGSTVRWVNGSRTFHTVTFSPSSGERVADGLFEESMFEVGDVVERIFAVNGRFSYFCQPHAAFMIGAVSVVEAPERTGRWVAGLTLLGLSAVGTTVALAGRFRARRRLVSGHGDDGQGRNTRSSV